MILCASVLTLPPCETRNSVMSEEKRSVFDGYLKLLPNFVLMNENTERPLVTCDNLIIIDADFADRVAFDLIVNFERIIGRPIPNADLARWIDCLALDGGIREGDSHTQVAIIHSKEKTRLDYFVPGDFKEELHGKAFSDNLGEFAITTLSEEPIISRAGLLADTLQLALHAQEVRRVIVVPDEEYYDDLRAVIRKAGQDTPGQQVQKHVTLMAMQPMAGGNFFQEILGYSLMSALGIRGDEIHPTDKTT